MAYHQPHPAEVPVVSARFGDPRSATLAGYLDTGGYAALAKVLGLNGGEPMPGAAIIEEVKKSSLRGRGGAGFPTGLKWSFIPQQSPKPKYVLCNADESEPGTCKDRLILEHDPFAVIEGVTLAGRAIGAASGFIYIRGEYRYLFDIMQRALAEAYAGGYLGADIRGSGWGFDILAHSGAGAYECGEESALMESLEGKRGIPRMKPPFPATNGLYDCPTVINNVETLASVPPILVRGGDWFLGLGLPKNGGPRLFSLSGQVKNRGVYELPLGFPLRRLIEEVGGGVVGGELKAVVPGGSSTPVFTAEEALGLQLDYDSVAKAGSFLGSGGVVIINDQTCMVKFALRIMQFYRHESCGWCVPCREGTNWLQLALGRFHAGGGRSEDIDLFTEVAQDILGHTLCALGDAAAMPIMSIVRKFRREFEDHLDGKPCPCAGPGGTSARPSPAA